MTIGYDDANDGNGCHSSKDGNGWYVQKKITFCPNIQLLKEPSTCIIGRALSM